MTSNKKTYDSGENKAQGNETGGIGVSSIVLSGDFKRQKGGGRPVINPDQLTSLSAMIAYVASKSGTSEFRVERALSDSFKVANAKFLPAHDFDAAIRYLADIIH